jgi:hypothetical protein
VVSAAHQRLCTFSPARVPAAGARQQPGACTADTARDSDARDVSHGPSNTGRVVLVRKRGRARYGVRGGGG